MTKVWGGVLAATGAIACPCHFPVTLPLLLGVLGGTSVGSFIGSHTSLVYGIASGYFIASLGAGWYLLNRKRVSQGAACEVPVQRRGDRSGQQTSVSRNSKRRVKARQRV